MKHWLSIASRSAVTLAAVWCVAAATPLVAQQVTAPAPQPAVSTPQASAANTSLPGPRLSTEWRRVEPRVADNSAATTASSGSTTITVTTLVLVLVVIIAVLLIAK